MHFLIGFLSKPIITFMQTYSEKMAVGTQVFVLLFPIVEPETI